MNAARTVLVVDDNLEICDVIQDFLKSHAFDVHCAHNGAEALSLIDTHRFDLAIIDLLLPGGLSGDDIASHAIERNAKIITISGALASDTHGHDIHHPHLLKPFRMDALLKAIEKALQTAGSR